MENTDMCKADRQSEASGDVKVSIPSSNSSSSAGSGIIRASWFSCALSASLFRDSSASGPADCGAQRKLDKAIKEYAAERKQHLVLANSDVADQMSSPGLLLPVLPRAFCGVQHVF